MSLLRSLKILRRRNYKDAAPTALCEMENGSTTGNAGATVGKNEADNEI
jgi:hypothetical protein